MALVDFDLVFHLKQMDKCVNVKRDRCGVFGHRDMTAEMTFGVIHTR